MRKPGARKERLVISLPPGQDTSFEFVAVVRKMMMPDMAIAQLSKEEGISDVTLYTWRMEARDKGLNVPGKKSQDGQWSSEAWFSVVLGS